LENYIDASLSFEYISVLQGRSSADVAEAWDRMGERKTSTWTTY